MTLIILVFSFTILLAIVQHLFISAYFKPLKFSILVLLIFLAAFRPPDIDRDYSTYTSFFQNTESPVTYIQNSFLAAMYEPTYYLIPSLLKYSLKVANFPFWTFFIYALLGVSFKLVGINKLTDYFFLSVLIYGSSFFFLHEMTQIRAGVASGIFLCSIPSLYNRHHLKYILLIIFAFLFHYSAIVLLPLMLLQTKRINTTIYASLLTFTLTLAFINSSIINDVLFSNISSLSSKADAYKNLAENEVGTFGEINKLNILFLIQFCMAIFLLSFIRKIQAKNKYAPLLLKTQIIGLLTFQLFAAIPTLAFRISEMLLIVQIVTFTFSVHIFQSKWIGFIVCLLYAIGLYFLNIYYLGLFKDFQYNFY